MTVRVVVSLSADRDVDRLEDWTADENPRAVSKVGPLLKAAFLSLADMPERTHRAGEDAHELLVPFGQRGYVICYRFVGDTVVVTRVFHALEDRS